MKQTLFYVSKNGSHDGPFTKEQILECIHSQKNDWTDYIFDEVKNDWVLIMEHMEFTEAFNAGLRLKMNSSSQPMTENIKNLKHKEKAWFILKDGNNYGPFSQLELVQMLQEKALFEFDYIWHQSFPSWKKVAEVEDFSSNEIKKLRNSLPPDLSDVFFRRRHLRARYGCSLIVHNNKFVFRGSSLEISAGGAGIVVESSELENGQTLFLHFQPGDGVPPFNAVCTVVSKQQITNLSGQRTVKYGVRFTSISTNIREQIKNFAFQIQRVA